MDLKEYLFRKNMSYNDFAELIDYTPVYVSCITRKVAVPSKRCIKAIIAATNGLVTEEDLKSKEYSYLLK